MNAVCLWRRRILRSEEPGRLLLRHSPFRLEHQLRINGVCCLRLGGRILLLGADKGRQNGPQQRGSPARRSCLVLGADWAQCSHGASLDRAAGWHRQHGSGGAFQKFRRADNGLPCSDVAHIGRPYL
eukprot:69369-Rhodomonas_salina.2